MNFLQNLFGRIRAWLQGIWERTERRDRVRFFVIAGVSITLLIAALVLLNQNRYAKVADVTDTATLASATTVLTDNNIPYKIVDSTSIMVDNKNLARAASLLTFSEQVGAEVSYSIYAEATGLTATESEKKYYAKAQTEVHLKERLELSEFVKQARVNLYLPDNSRALFAKEMQQSTASVTLVLADGIDSLTKTQIAGVEGNISGATGISPDNIIITDQNMRLLNPKGEDDSSAMLESRLAYQASIEGGFNEKLGHLLLMLLGPSGFSVTTTAKLDFSDHTVDSIVYSPVVDDTGIARSVQDIDEAAIGRAYANGQPGLDEDGAGDEYAVLEGSDVSEYTKASQTINYEISQMVESITYEKGRITDLFAGITISDAVMENTSANIAMMKNHIGTVLGLTGADIDKCVSVVIAKPVGLEKELEQQAIYNDTLRQQRFYSLIQTIVLYTIIGLCILLLVWRTLALFKPKTIELEPMDDIYVDNLADYNDLVEAAVTSLELEVTKSASRERVEEFIESNPDAVANMLRTWLGDEGESKW